MKYSKLQRFYTTDFLSQKQSVIITGAQFNHILRVLRMRKGEQCRVFNEKDGEFRAVIREISKEKLTLELQELLRKPQEDRKNCAVAIGIIKPDMLKFAVLSLSALGVKHIYPVIFARGQLKNLNIDKHQQIALQAACQSEAMQITQIMPTLKLPELLSEVATNYDKVYFADEEAGIENEIKQIKTADEQNKMLIIGPEGGITDQERQTIKQMNNCQPISLGSRVLRTELAAIYAATFL